MKQLSVRTESQQRVYFYKGFVPFKNIRQRLSMWIGSRTLNSPFWAWVERYIGLYPEFSEPVSYGDLYHPEDTIPCSVQTAKQFAEWQKRVHLRGAYRTIEWFMGNEYFVGWREGKITAEHMGNIPY